jgi:hypothetical protein
MTTIDYLLLGVFAGASVYTICRLLVGLRNSSAAPVRMGATEDENQAAAPARCRAASATRAPGTLDSRRKKE